MMVTSTPTNQPHSIRCHDDDDDVCGERCKYSGHLSELRNCVSQNMTWHGRSNFTAKSCCCMSLCRFSAVRFGSFKRNLYKQQSNGDDVDDGHILVSRGRHCCSWTCREGKDEVETFYKFAFAEEYSIIIIFKYESGFLCPQYSANKANETHRRAY